ncbi:MAG TPA: hypothetical protein VK074_04880, partial [Fodinibius sp.]|nr:hypothetical protein [Fodinibius sp.]
MRLSICNPKAKNAMYKKFTYRQCFCICLLLMTACSSQNKVADQQNPRQQLYKNTDYAISFRIPQQWDIAESTNLKVGDYALNVFKKGTNARKSLPLNVHTPMKHSYVTFWPHGYGTEFPYSQMVSFQEANSAKVPDLQFAVNKKKSTLFLLKDGSVWGYFIAPKQPPNGWDTYGFIHAQVRTTNVSAVCYDQESGEKLSNENCNYMGGDQYIRSGNLNKQ